MASANIHTALILAGGQGTRLRSVVADRPKVLAPVAGRPFIKHLLQQLLDAGLREVILCTGYMAESVRIELGDNFGSMALKYSEEKEPLGTGGALRNALPFIANGEEILVLNGDSFCESDIGALTKFHLSKGAIATIALRNVPDTSRYGQVELGPSEAVEIFAEKGDKRGSGLINAGIYLINDKIIRELPEGVALSLERDVLPQLIGKGLFGFRINAGRFIDIGTPESFSESQSVMKKRDIL